MNVFNINEHNYFLFEDPLRNNVRDIYYYDEKISSIKSKSFFQIKKFYPNISYKRYLILILISIQKYDESDKKSKILNMTRNLKIVWTLIYSYLEKNNLIYSIDWNIYKSIPLKKISEKSVINYVSKKKFKNREELIFKNITSNILFDNLVFDNINFSFSVMNCCFKNCQFKNCKFFHSELNVSFFNCYFSGDELVFENKKSYSTIFINCNIEDYTTNKFFNSLKNFDKFMILLKLRKFK